MKISSPLTAIFLTFILLISTSFQGCKNDDDNLIPFVAVDFTIDITSTFYTELSAVGGYVYVTGGYKGIVIYRLSMDEFLAYDRCCPFDPKVPCERVEMESSGLTLIDSCCGSRFNILDGSVIEGPATHLLRQYFTYYDGRYLRVYN